MESSVRSTGQSQNETRAIRQDFVYLLLQRLEVDIRAKSTYLRLLLLVLGYSSSASSNAPAVWFHSPHKRQSRQWGYVLRRLDRFGWHEVRYSGFAKYPLMGVFAYFETVYSIVPFQAAAVRIVVAPLASLEEGA